jgi:hypothetical protein
MATERDEAGLDNMLKQWERDRNKLKEELDKLQAAIEGVNWTQPGVISENSPSRPKPTKDSQSPKIGITASFRSYVDEVVEDGAKISVPECTRWILAHGVDGEYAKVVKHMHSIINRESERPDSMVVKDPEMGFRKRRIV